jgi:hypothetical protein
VKVTAIGIPVGRFSLTTNERFEDKSGLNFGPVAPESVGRPEAEIHLYRVAQEEHSVECLASCYVAMSDGFVIAIHSSRSCGDYTVHCSVVRHT